MKKLFIETYGCQMNVADSEVVASVMQMAGYESCESVEEADAVFLNTCSVRDNAEQKIYHRLEALGAIKRKRGLIVGVLGCMAERVKDDLLENHGCDLVAGPDAYLSLPDLVAQAETGHKAINIELSTSETYKDVVPQRIGLGHKIGGFVSIMRGCNNFCHYCIVPYTRGRERSRDVESILREVRDLRDRGFKEVTLLGQNVNSYQFIDQSSESIVDFPQLLRRVAKAAPEMRIRFTTSHPKDMSDETLRVIAEEPNVCKHIHLPVQSGSDRILKLMNRKYTREWYMDRVAAIRRIIPDCGLSTDIFVGYHDETEEDHQLSLSLMREVGYDSAFMFRAPMLRSTCPIMFQRKKKYVDSMSSSHCRQRFLPSRTRKTRARSSTCSSRASQNVVANSSADVPNRTRWWSSTKVITTSERPFACVSPVRPVLPC